MPLTTQQHEQFIVLMTGDFNLNLSSLKNHHQDIIVANKHHDILMLIETTRFNLILLDLTANCSELISRIRAPLCINNSTPVIAVINPTEDFQTGKQYSLEFDDSLTGPLTEDRFNEVIDCWQTKALALDYIQIILSKTKNNQRLTLTLFEKLFEELPLQVIAIKAALESKQYDLAKDITHKLNGSVSFCGLQDIQQPANALENCLLTDNYAGINQHFLMLQRCLLNFTRHQEFILTTLGK